jgi:hypothetical protein
MSSLHGCASTASELRRGDLLWSPPATFIAYVVDLTMRGPAQRDGELDAHLSPHCAPLGEPQVAGIRPRTAKANITAHAVGRGHRWGLIGGDLSPHYIATVKGYHNRETLGGEHEKGCLSPCTHDAWRALPYRLFGSAAHLTKVVLAELEANDFHIVKKSR